MPAYLVELPSTAQASLPDGANAAVVFAADADDAKSIIKANYTGDSNAAWDAATATEIAAAADMEGFRLRVAVLDADPVIDVTVTAAAADTIDDMGDDMVVALNALDAIGGAAYNDSTQVLTIAAGSGADDLGDKAVVVELLAPTTMEGAGKAPIGGFVGAITDEGLATADLNVTLGADTVAVPALYAMVKQT